MILQDSPKVEGCSLEELGTLSKGNEWDPKEEENMSWEELG